MWYGKVAIIDFMFCMFILFFTYYVNTIYHDPWITNNITYQNVNQTVSAFQFNQEVNIGLIFGDFYHVFVFIVNLMTANATNGIFSMAQGDAGVLHQTGFADLSVGLLLAITFDSSVVFLILYIVSNRSL